MKWKFIRQFLGFGDIWECSKCGTINMNFRWYCGNCGKIFDENNMPKPRACGRRSTPTSKRNWCFSASRRQSDEIPEFFWKVLKTRFEKMPGNLRITIGNLTLTKDEILECLEKKNETGKLLAKIELEYLRLITKQSFH
ncbi:MAG: hypothetical protein QXF61_04335 [Nitrososphaeria archaeon]